ncbi:hypothetical protein LCGC14_0864360 [marine sediment metagenome]|uniref:Uncharacterized protein n=1 Tax=marine sediment metagenome TaxID=412755 RepID=A0A0F9PBG8_9ZZZZ
MVEKMNKMKGKFQSIPSLDSNSIEPFEGLVEAYYQINGYITSANKWFWYWQDPKRHYMDIDVLAVNSNETIIVSVSGSLDKKIGLSRNGRLKDEMLKDLFVREQAYMRNVPQYQWLIEDRSVKKVIAFIWGNKLKERLLNHPKFPKNEIKLLSSNEILSEFEEKIEILEKFQKSNNPFLKTIQLFIKRNKFTEM